MGARHSLALSLLALAACPSNRSRLDTVEAKGSGSAANDPWSSSTAKVDTDKKDNGGGALDGVDLKDMLSKVAEAIEKPGPYEAPEKSADFDETKPHWGVMKVSGDIVEREAFSLTGGGRGTELRTVIDRLRALAKDDKLTGLLLRLGSVDVSLPDVTELRAAMRDFRATGKKLACHTEDASNSGYLVLSACEVVGLAPLGQVAITGPAAMPIHVKPLLDKLGVTADFLYVGAYKGAAEPLTRDAPSNEMRETLGAILDRRYLTMVETIATERKLTPDVVKTLIDTALFPSEQAKAAKLVDEVTSFEDMRAKLITGPWTKLDVEPDTKDQLQTMLKLARFVGAMPPVKPLGDHIAVVYALGDIVDGGGDGVLGARQEIASHTLVSALRAMTADDSIKAVVLRIDSGGGSAQASELIWQAVTALKAKKPVIVSMSDVAASGGYYIAAPANKIFAEADTLTGSIGVVGGKIAPGNALAKLGVNTFPMGRGKRATMMASLYPWSADEKAVIQNSMEEVYRVFVGRVAQGRNKKYDDIHPIAQGRVWTGTRAKELGLVDEIGGLDAAIAMARDMGKVDATTGIEVYPPSPTLRDMLSSFGGVSSPFGLQVDSALNALESLDPTIGAEAKRLLRLALSFQGTKIQALAILPVIR
ncbi:MAG: signal peptide peptidase SppA [Deltaproteobacteria bacterium]|nr:signal peptide peptidase SppA [Deltaproteobacteria bacterium]